MWKFGARTESLQPHGAETVSADVVTWSTLHGKQGKSKEAMELLEEIQESNVVTWNTLITAHGRHGNFRSNGTVER